MAPLADDGIKSGQTQLLHLPFRGYSRRGQGDWKSQRDKEFAVKIMSLSMKRHQHDCLNKTRTRVAPIDMLSWVGMGRGRGKPTGHQHCTKDYRQPRNANSRRNSFP